MCKVSLFCILSGSWHSDKIMDIDLYAYKLFHLLTPPHTLASNYVSLKKKSRANKYLFTTYPSDNYLFHENSSQNIYFKNTPPPPPPPGD